MAAEQSEQALFDPGSALPRGDLAGDLGKAPAGVSKERMVTACFIRPF